MILDKLNEFADATSIAHAAGTFVVGDVIDLGAPPAGSTYRDIGNGRPVYLVVQVDTGLDSNGGAATANILLVSDSEPTMATSKTTHAQTGALNESTAVAGYTQVIPLPWGVSATYERYLGVMCTIAGETSTAGKINAFLTLDPSAWVAYTDGI